MISVRAIPACAGLAIAFAIGAMALAQPAADSVSTADVIVTEYTYEGAVTRAGVLLQWRYASGHMEVEFADGGDGLFRNSFEGAP